MKIKLSDYELGWLVGVLEGEGCFSYRRRTHSVEINMTDFDVMNTVASMFCKLTGKEVKVTTVSNSKANCKEAWRTYVIGEPARIVMKTVVPYMHARRRARIWQSLNGYVQKEQTFKELGIDITQLIGKHKEQEDVRNCSNERRSSPQSDGGDSGSGDPDDTGDPNAAFGSGDATDDAASWR